MKRDGMIIFEIILLLIFTTETNQMNAATNAYVAKSVADWFKVNCIIFFHFEDVTSKEIHETFKAFKIMSDGMKTVAARKFQLETTVYRYNNQRCSQMLHVIDGRHDEARLRLEEVFHSENLGGPIWMIFLPATDTTEEYLENTYISFDSNFISVETRDSLVLRQVYRVSMNHDIRSIPFANWTLDGGLTVHSEYSPHWHRNDLEGKSFRVSAIESWPLATLTRDTTVGGYFGSVWKELQERMNFTSIYVKPKEFATGVWNDGKWNGLVGMISRGEIDAAISEVTMTPERISVVDFLKPLYTTRYQLFYKSPGMAIQWDLILRPFRTEVWLTLLLWLGLLTLLLNIGHQIGLKYGLEDPKDTREYESYHCLFLVASAFSQQANATLPKSSSCRLVLATVYMFSVIVLIIYSCILMSMIAVQKPCRPFNSLESFLQDGTYNLQQIPGTDAYSYFSNSTEPVLQMIYQTQFSNKPEKDLPASRGSALDRVCEGEKIAHVSEFGIAMLSADELQQKKGCHFIYLDRPLKLLYLTIATAKDSPYRDAFDYQIGQMAVTGILDRFRNRNFPLRKSKTEVTFQSVSIEQTAQMNLLFVAGSIAAIFIFVCELLMKKNRD